MCLECQGWTREQVLKEHVEIIDRVGWSITGVEPDKGSTEFAYTSGLTRFDGHPEVLVSGLQYALGAQVLNALGSYVKGGRRFQAGDELRSIGPVLGHLRFVRVSNPLRLVTAQEIYGGPLGPVPAVQAVWANAKGFFPGQQGWCRDHDGRQELFGRIR